jgi:hypothetical protein
LTASSATDEALAKAEAIGAAVLYQRHRETLEGRVAQWIPPGLKALLPPARE